MPHPFRSTRRPAPTKQIALALGLALAALCLPACQTARVDKTVMGQLGDVEPDVREVEFWSRLNGKPLISNDDALHGLILFFYQTDASDSYEKRVAFLREKGLLAGDFKEPAEQAFTRGRFAVAVAQGLKVEGGIMHSLFPMSQRYALRHLESEELFPPSSPNQTVSGTDYVGIIGRAEDYERVRRLAAAPAPAKDLDKVDPNQKREKK